MTAELHVIFGAGPVGCWSAAPERMMYRFTAPFVVDSKRIERGLGMPSTPIEAGIERRVAWYRERGGAKTEVRENDTPLRSG